MAKKTKAAAKTTSNETPVVAPVADPAPAPATTPAKGRKRTAPAPAAVVDAAPAPAPAAADPAPAATPAPAAPTTDAFGLRLGSKASQFAAKLTRDPKPMKQLMEEAGTTRTFYNLMKRLIGDGKVRKVGTSYALPE